MPKPHLGWITDMLSKDEVVKKFKKDISLAKTVLASQYDNIKKCQAAYSGDLMTYKDSINVVDTRGRMKNVMVQFNKIKPYVNAVRGFMAQNRRKAEYTARVEDDQQQELYSQYLNSLSDYTRDLSNADQVETQQDGDFLIGGIGAVETNISYDLGFSTRSTNGEVQIMRLDPLSCFYDPTARQTNVLDAKFVGCHKVYDRQQAYELFDDNNPQDFESAYMTETGNKMPWPAGGHYDKIQEIFDYADAKADQVKVYFYQWYDIETYYRAANPIYSITDQQQVLFAQQRLIEIADDMDEDDFDPMARILNFSADTKSKLEEFFGDTIETDQYKKRCYYTAVLSGKKVFTVFKSVCQNGFTIKFKTGDWDDTKRIWVGMVNQMIEPATYYNKALTELMFAIASSAKGGVMVEESAVDDIAKFEQKYAKTDSVVVVNDGAISGGKIMPKREQYQPNGVDGLISITDGAIADTSGLDKSFLGSSENKLETATLQRQRIKQVSSVLATYFDSITLYAREHARLMIDILRVFAENNDGQLFKVTDPETGKVGYARISLSNIASDYDIGISEGLDSAAQNEERANLLNNIADRLISVGDPSAKIIYATAIKYLPLDLQDKSAIRKALLPDAQQPDPAYVKQLETQISQLQNEAQQAQVQNLMSNTAKNFAQVEEINAKVRSTNASAVKTLKEGNKIDMEIEQVASGAPNASIVL